MPQRNHKQLFSAKRSSFIKIFFEIIFHKFIQKHISTLPIFKPSHPRSKVVGRYIVVYTPNSCRVIIVMEQIPEIGRKIKLGFSSIFFLPNLCHIGLLFKVPRCLLGKIIRKKVTGYNTIV